MIDELEERKIEAPNMFLMTAGMANFMKPDKRSNQKVTAIKTSTPEKVLMAIYSELQYKFKQHLPYNCIFADMLQINFDNYITESLRCIDIDEIPELVLYAEDFDKFQHSPYKMSKLIKNTRKTIIVYSDQKVEQFLKTIEFELEIKIPVKAINLN
jgi:hypothetical protein